MSVLNEVSEALSNYKKNSGDDPRFIIMPVGRTRELLTDLIEIQGKNCPAKVIKTAHISNDNDFADALCNLKFAGVNIMVVTTQIVVGGWAENGSA